MNIEFDLLKEFFSIFLQNLNFRSKIYITIPSELCGTPIISTTLQPEGLTKTPDYACTYVSNVLTISGYIYYSS